MQIAPVLFLICSRDREGLPKRCRRDVRQVRRSLKLAVVTGTIAVMRIRALRGMTGLPFLNGAVACGTYGKFDDGDGVVMVLVGSGFLVVFRRVRRVRVVGGVWHVIHGLRRRCR